MQWQPTPVLLPGKSHGQKSLVGCNPWGRQESDTTERLHFHFSLSCIGKGNGNPLQCSCLENPRDGGAWWAAVCGVAQSWTRLKRLSSSSSNSALYTSLVMTYMGCCCSVAKLCLTLRDPINGSTPGFPILHYLLGFAQTHVHWVYYGRKGFWNSREISFNIYNPNLWTVLIATFSFFFRKVFCLTTKWNAEGYFTGHTFI